MLAAATPSRAARTGAAPDGEPAASAPPAPVWMQQLDPALATAAKGDRYLLVDLYAEWCGWCKKLDREVFSSAAFAEAARDYVLLRVDVEDGAEGTWLQERLGVTGLPALAILDPRLVRVGLVQGYYPTPLFLSKLRQQVASYEYVVERDAERAKSDDPGELNQLGAELRGRGDGARAAAIYRRLLARPKLPAAERAWLEIGLAESQRLARDFAGAAKTLTAARTTAGDAAAESRADLEDAADVATVRLAHDRGGCPGVSTLEALLRTRPESKQSLRAKREIAELRSDEAGGCS